MVSVSARCFWWRLVITGLVAVFAQSAIAQSTIGIPNQCTGYLTVQARGCHARHFMTCTDLPDTQLRALYINANDDQQLATVTLQGEFISSYFVNSGRWMVADGAPNDALSITTVFPVNLS